MFLKRIEIKHFRVINELTLNFNKGLNVLIGENNSGKSSIIDALRLCLTYGNQFRDIYINVNDFHINKMNPDEPAGDIEFHLFFEITKPEEAGIFIDLLSIQQDGGYQELQLHFKYYIQEDKGNKKVRWKVWGGDKEGQTVTPEVLDALYFVYLEPLRDAVHYLRPIRGNRLGQLYSNLRTDKAIRDNLAGKVRNLLKNDNDWNVLLKEGEENINEHLIATSIEGKTQKVNINFIPFEYQRIVESLRVQTPVFDDESIGSEEEKQVYFELYQNGLGVNNLIYTAVVLGDLKRKKTQESETYIALLIEEPEAHLHPQLQNILFNYLNSLEDIGLQIFISSHSPTITSKANLDSLIVLQNQNQNVSALSLNNSELDTNNKKYLHKFLDVTKSQLFFANGVIFVEGISEALLLSTFSKILGGEYQLDKNGIEIVNINGVAFSHFAKLFNSADVGKRLNSRAAIITDDDRTLEVESSRAMKALALQGGSIKVMLGKVTFEYELFVAGENKVILNSIFANIRPRASANIEANEDVDQYAKNFVAKVTANQAKSELAHQLAIKLEEDAELRDEFIVPKYIEEAIKWVVKGE
jgi:putative ATP-dependent endonuclease of the OLD family